MQKLVKITRNQGPVAPVIVEIPEELPEDVRQLEAIAIKLAFRPREDRWELGRVLAKLHDKMDSVQFKNFCRTNLQITAGTARGFTLINENFTKLQVRQFGVTKCKFVMNYAKSPADRRKAMEMLKDGAKLRDIVGYLAPDQIKNVPTTSSWNYERSKPVFADVFAAAKKLSKADRIKLAEQLWSTVKGAKQRAA